MDLENAEEILQILERYTKQKSKTIPDELNGYLTHVASTGDSVYTWSKVQFFFREKLAHVLKEFHDTTPRNEDVPLSRNVDAFNYDTMKSTLLERFDLFNAAPFTIQRLSELLNEPKKHYCRLDKFMRALEKNILVVSTVEPGHRQMGSENGDSINGDPLMDINVDVEMDKEPSSSCVPSTEIKSTEAELDSNMDDTSTQNKTEQGTSEQCEDDAEVNTNGHHVDADELNDTVEDPKVDDEDTVESTDKTDDSSTSVETITVEVPPAELPEKVNSPEVIAAVSDPLSEASQVTAAIEQPKETLAETESLSDEKKTPQAASSSVALPAKEEEDTNEIIVETKTEKITESVKHSLDRDGDDDDYQPTAAKLAKIDEKLTPVEPVVVSPETQLVDVAETDAVPSKGTVLEEQQTTEVKETISEAVLSEASATTEIPQQPVEEQPAVVEKIVASEPTIVDKPTPVVSRLELDATTAIPAEIEPVQPDAIDDTNNDTVSSDTTISPLASTLSNDLDLLQEDEDELIEPIPADAELILPEPAALAETDVEMMPSIDSAEQMTVEDPTPVLASTNSDSAMDATQIIPSTADEQMDVIENNSMDEDL